MEIYRDRDGQFSSLSNLRLMRRYGCPMNNDNCKIISPVGGKLGKNIKYNYLV